MVMRAKFYSIIVFILSFILIYSFGYCEENEIVLEDITVTETRDKENYGTEITKEDINRTEAKSLWDTLRYIPGVVVTEGGTRGDASFSIRGMDSSKIPIILDGIAITNPFNGMGDAGAIMVDDLESIVIQKGFSSMLYGANGMGGAVLLQTAKPKKPFEAMYKTSAEFDSIFKFSSMKHSLSLGSKTDKVYVKASLQYRDIDHFRLSDKFQPMQGSMQQSGERLFSDRQDIKGTFIAGTDYFDNLDIWATYVYEDSNRGLNEPEATSLYDITEWKYWKRHSISLNGKYEKDNFFVDFIGYFDKYDNQFNEYASLIHYEKERPYAVSIYDEYSSGFRVKGEYNFLENQYLRGAFTFREDYHLGYYDKVEDILVKEDRISLGLEYSAKVLDKLTFIVSGGFDSLIPSEYRSRDDLFAQIIGVSSYNVTPKDRWLLTAQAGIFYEFVKNNELRLTYARRNQFPTMSDRYSTRFSETLPNPNLRPETADHVELGYKGTLFDMLLIDTSLYYSYVSDKMAVINVPDPFMPQNTVEYMTNLDAVSLYGYELAATLYLFDYAELGANLSVNEYFINKSIDRIKAITYYPEIVFNSYLKITPCTYFSIMPQIEYTDKRYIDLDGINYLKPYFLVNLFLDFNISDNYKISLYAKNLTDEDYSFRYGYPLRGRTFGVTVRAEF